MPSLFIPVATMEKHKQINNVSDIILLIIHERTYVILLTQNLLL